MSTLVGGTGRPPLFQIREPRRRFAGPFLLVMGLHAGVLVGAARRLTVDSKPAAEPVKVVLRLPIRKMAVNEPPGGGAKRPPPPARRPRVRHRVRPPEEIPPPVVETPPPPPEDPPAVAEADDGLDEDDAEGTGDPAVGGGGGWGTGSGPGSGSGHGSVASKARKAWLLNTDWRCRRPGYEDLGRIVVRLRVEVEPDGKPGQVSVVSPGPEPFNRRAIDCARDETYLPALDPEGRPIPGACEFSIEFLN